MKFRELFKEGTTLPDWEKIFSIDEFKVMETCEQSKVWHGEGQVSKHTILVTDAMKTLLDGLKDVDENYYIMMMAAAICHDLGKPSTTVFDKEKGDYATKCHGVEGARITRRLFFDEDFELRENVCYMVRQHMVLHHIFDKEHLAEKKIITLSHGRVTVKDMLMLNICDSLGSKNEMETEDSIIEKGEKIKGVAKRLDCYTKPYDFSSEYEKIKFFHENKTITPEDIPSPEDYGQFTIYVMVGVPGSGKSYYIENNMKDVPVLSRDLIRTEIGIKGIKPQGNKHQEELVTEIFDSRMLEYCKNKQDFVIDNTNVRKMYRKGYTDVALRFHAKIVYIYVEASDLETYKKRREGLMPLEVIDKMWNYFDFPEPTEYNEFILSKQKIKNN